MNKRIRTALVAVSALATLSFASAALAANTGSVSVWHTPQTLASSASTTIHVKVPQDTNPIAAVNIYSGTGYTINTSQAANTQIGTVDATAFSRDNNLILPLAGTVVTSDATAAANKTGSAQCAGVPQSQAVWLMNLSVAGNTLAIPVYVNPTAGPEQTLGGYKTLNLLNSHEDATFLRSMLFYQIAQTYVPAPKANMIIITFPNRRPPMR